MELKLTSVMPVFAGGNVLLYGVDSSGAVWEKRGLDPWKPISMEAEGVCLGDYVQLHESVEIHYYVDHYAAEFYTQDGQVLAAVGHGSTVQKATSNLTLKLKDKSLKEWRQSKGVE